MRTAVAAVAGLGGGAVLLAGLAATTGRRPAPVVLDRAGYLERWRALHGGYDPGSRTPVVRGWLTLAYRISVPLARRGVQPDLVTAASVWFALAALVAAGAGGHGPLLGAVLLVVSGLVDSLDGCVAVLQQRTSAWGYVLDSSVDRVNEVLFLTAMVSVGVPLPLAVAVGAGGLLLEYVRARACNAGGRAGRDDVLTVTVAERPTRVIVVALSLALAGTLVDRAGLVATVGLSVLAGLTAVGLAQLVAAVRRQLREPPPDRPTLVRAAAPTAGG